MILITDQELRERLVDKALPEAQQLLEMTRLRQAARLLADGRKPGELTAAEAEAAKRVLTVGPVVLSDEYPRVGTPAFDNRGNEVKEKLPCWDVAEVVKPAAKTGESTLPPPKTGDGKLPPPATTAPGKPKA